VYFYTRGLTLYLFLFNLIWYLEPRVKSFFREPTVHRHHPAPPLSLLSLPSSPGLTTSPSGVPHPGDHRVVGIETIRAAMRLNAPFLSLFTSPLPPRMAARQTSFPEAINVVMIVVLRVFWICPHHLNRSPFEF